MSKVSFDKSAYRKQDSMRSIVPLSYDELVPYDDNCEPIYDDPPQRSKIAHHTFDNIDAGVTHVCLNCTLIRCILDKGSYCGTINKARMNHANTLKGE